MGQISTAKRRQLLAAQYSQDRKLWQSLNIQSPVDYLVTAQVDLAVNSMADYVPMPGMANLKKAAASIAVRMVNANTGEVIYAGNFRGKSERRSNNAENEAINAASAGIAKAIGEAALNKGGQSQPAYHFGHHAEQMGQHCRYYQLSGEHSRRQPRLCACHFLRQYDRGPGVQRNCP